MSQGLSAYRPWWDQTRAQVGAERVFEDDDLLIATDFECGNGRAIRPLGGDRYAMDLEPDPGAHRFSGKSYYFCFGVRSKRGGSRQIRMRLRNCGFPEWYAWTRHVVTRRGDAWGQLPPEAIRGDPEQAALDLDLVLPAASEDAPEVFFSNFHWHPYTDMQVYLRRLAARDDRVRLSSLGRSFQGREITCVELGSQDPAAPHAVLAQTPQPSEMGPWSCRAVLEWLLSDDPRAGEVLTRHRVTLLPHANPDGTVLGYGVSDARGRFPFFEGAEVAAGAPNPCPELLALWRHLEAARPWLFIEWHSNNWSKPARPGHVLLRYVHELLGDATRRRIWDAWEEAMLRLPETTHQSWTDGTGRGGGYEATMGFAAVTRLGVAACMVKHHDRFPHAQILRHAVACYRVAIDAYDEVTGGQ